jgi:hypothetical protein
MMSVTYAERSGDVDDEVRPMWTLQAVGETAGRVWQVLHRNGKSSLSVVKRETKTPEPLVLMAIGWLAREGKIDFHRQGRALQLWLKEEY